MQAVPGLPALSHAVSGSDLAPPLTALSLVGLAAVAAVVGTRGLLRSAVGLLVAAVGATVVAYAWAGARATPSAGTAHLAGTVVGVRHTAWPGVAVAGGVLLVVGGATTLAHGRRWAALGGRYDAPVAARAERANGEPGAPSPAADARGATPDKRLWEALDRGEDPTA